MAERLQKIGDLSCEWEFEGVPALPLLQPFHVNPFSVGFSSQLWFSFPFPLLELCFCGLFYFPNGFSEPDFRLLPQDFLLTLRNYFLLAIGIYTKTPDSQKIFYSSSAINLLRNPYLDYNIVSFLVCFIIAHF